MDLHVFPIPIPPPTSYDPVLLTILLKIVCYFSVECLIFWIYVVMSSSYYLPSSSTELGYMPWISSKQKVISTSLMDSSQIFWLEYIIVATHQKIALLTVSKLRFIYGMVWQLPSLLCTVTCFPCDHQVLHVCYFAILWMSNFPSAIHLMVLNWTDKSLNQ